MRQPFTVVTIRTEIMVLDNENMVVKKGFRTVVQAEVFVRKLTELLNRKEHEQQIQNR